MWPLVGFVICDKRILTIMHSRRLRWLFTHHNEANGSQKKTKSRDQKKTNKDQKTNKDDRSENRQETEEREDQKKQMGIHI